MCFNPTGSLLAWCNGQEVKIAELRDGEWAHKCRIPVARASFMAFSPKGSVLATWEVFSTKAGQAAQPNLTLWNPETGDRLGGFVSKKAAAWCLQWSKDESLCCVKSPNNEVHFYRNNDFDKVDGRLSIAKLDSFSLSPNSERVNPVVCFVPGQKGGPGFGKLFLYPNLNSEKDVIANKSFFQSDKMDVEWSGDGKMALLITQSEVRYWI